MRFLDLLKYKGKFIYGGHLKSALNTHIPILFKLDIFV